MFSRADIDKEKEVVRTTGKAHVLSAGLLLLETSAAGRQSWYVRIKQGAGTRKKKIGEFPAMGLKEAKRIAAQMKADAEEHVSGGIKFIELFKEYAAQKVYKDRQSYRWLDLMMRYSEVLHQDYISDITRKNLADLILGIQEEHGAVVARKLSGVIKQVFDFAIIRGYMDSAPTALLSTLIKAAPRGHYECLLDPLDIGTILNQLENKDMVVTRAIIFVALTVPRSIELLRADWKDIDMDTAVWKLPAANMKMSKDHYIHLSPQALAILKKQREIADHGRVFQITKGAMLKTLDSESLKCHVPKSTIHGWRSTASSILNESGLWNPDAIEAALSHSPQGVRGAYMRSVFWDERVKMLDWYADKLDEYKELAKNKNR